MTEKKLKVLDLDTPPEITIKPSQVEAHKYGIWCKQLIKEGTKFGPFVGEKAYEVDETMDPAFIWEIVDVETKEFLFYINATNPRYGNWMRHINCARFFEEQNIVSEQEGIDIYYHAIKDIHPGEELLTWYEKSPVRKKKGKKKLFPNVKRARTGDESKVASKSSDYDSVSLRGRRRTARKFWEMEEVGVRTSVVEGQSSSEDDIVDSNANNDDDDDDEDWDAPKYGAATSNTKSRNSSQAPTAASSAANSVSSGRNSPNVDVSRESSLGMAPQELEKSKNEISASADPTRMYFHFESMVDQGGNGGSHSSTGGSWKNGRRVFRCDICSGVYRHSFSLKRHYVRCHINFKYLTKVDIIQCGVQPPKSVTASQEDMADVDDENITQNSSDGAVTAAASTSSEVPVPPTDGSPFEPHGEHSIFKEIVCSHKGLLMDLYRCNICDQFFDTKEELRYHLSNHPDGEAGGQRQFSCSHCKMQFKHRQNLLRHEVVHTGAKPFSCQQCHKSFPTATNQKRHERIHDGHRLTCDLCPATFTQTGDLKKHASKQHPESYNECAYCSKYFSVESALDAHLRKAHGKDVEANRRRVCVKKKEKKVLLEKDRAESRRLAIEEVEKRHPARGNAEESYACTVCRKCFHNYSNMCRHRRLAHYKDSKVDDFYGMEDEEEVGRVSIPSHQVHSSQQGGHQVGVSTRSSGVVSVELGYKHFLAVARNIPKNLEFFIEGTQQDLNNAKNHIKWKDNSKSHLDRPENDIKEDAHASDESSFTTIPNVSLEDYNFPKGFQITSKANHSASELEPPVVADNEKSLENEEGCDSKKESEHGPEDDKTFLKLCSVCKMNFADEKGFALHVFSCSSLAEVPPKPKATLTEDVHDYSRKANPEEEAYKVFPELSKLPINLFSGEEILDLSRHKNCIFMSSVDANGMSFPCIAPSEEPLDLTGSKERKILLNVNSTSADCSSVTVKNSSEFKSSTPNKSPTSPILHIKEEVNSPLSQSRSFTNGLVSTQQSTQMINIRPHKKIICLVCYMAFTDKENAIEHQELCHGNVDCRHAEVDEDFEISMLKVPKPVGLLSSSQIVFTGVADKLKDESLQNTEETNEAISKMTAEEHSKEPEVEKDQESLESSLKVDEVDVSTEELLMTVVSEATLMPPDVADLSEDAVVCTKCRLRFTDLCALHSHISESCGDYWRNLSERVSWVFVLRGNLVPPEREQPSGTNQPKKRGKFKWQQNSNPPLFRSNSSNEESLRKQLQSSSRNGTTLANLDAGRKQIGNKVLTRKRSQEIGAAVMSAMEDPDYYVRSKRRAFLQQQNSANASKKGMKRQTSLDLPPKIALTLTEGSDSNQANSSLDEETLANLSGEGFNEDNNDDDDDYDPNKFMCIYCRHQFQYTRTLRKHVLEFCHVRREYVEKGEYLDAEWEDDLNSKVQPPPVVQPVSEVAEENEEVKKSGGRKKKRRSWCSRGCSSNNHKQQPLVSQSHDLSSEVKQYNHLPVQLQLSIDQAQMLREAKKDSSSMSEVLLSIPMTTPGGTIVIKADDVHNGESDLLVSCDSIPNEVEDKVGVYKGSYNRAASVVSKAGNLVAASTSLATASVGIRSGDGGFVRSEQPSNATDMPVQFQQTSQNQETTQYSSSASHFVIAQDMNSRRFEDDDEEEEDATGLMMTVTSSPAIKQPQDSPWEASGKRSSSELPLVKKRKKLDLGPSTSCTSNSNSQLALDLMISKEEKP